jgi:hypothetical protein
MWEKNGTHMCEKDPIVHLRDPSICSSSPWIYHELSSPLPVPHSQEIGWRIYAIIDWFYPSPGVHNAWGKSTPQDMILPITIGLPPLMTLSSSTLILPCPHPQLTFENVIVQLINRDMAHQHLTSLQSPSQMVLEVLSVISSGSPFSQWLCSSLLWFLQHVVGSESNCI